MFYFFSMKCILLMGEAGCAQNAQRSYLRAAKRRTFDVFSVTQRARQQSSGLRKRGQWGSNVKLTIQIRYFWNTEGNSKGQNPSVCINSKPDVFKNTIWSCVESFNCKIYLMRFYTKFNLWPPTVNNQQGRIWFNYGLMTMCIKVNGNSPTLI